MTKFEKGRVEEILAAYLDSIGVKTVKQKEVIDTNMTLISEEKIENTEYAKYSKTPHRV